MRKKFLAPLFLIIIFLSCLSNTNDKGNAGTEKKQLEKDNTARSDGSFLNGSWTYRSLLNDPDWKLTFDQLQFASAIMDLKTFGKDSITGILYWSDNPKQGLNIKGNYYYQDTVLCYSLVGTGSTALGTPGWQYDYKGYAVSTWPRNVKQADVLVGSTLRAKPHGGAPAGFVATTYMVRRSK
ncbi:MAG: hypothetical protein WBC06_08085 [Chitinophagaceae bacterium]